MARRQRRSPSKSHDTATVGAIAEATLVSLLLSWGFEMYKPLVDVGTDFLAINPRGERLRIQCKGRGTDKDWLWDIRTDQLDRRHPPTHYFFIHGAPNTDDSWLVPDNVARKAWIRYGRKVRVTLTARNRKLFQPFRKDAGIRDALLWTPEK
jgi:hypothetical protein